MPRGPFNPSPAQRQILCGALRRMLYRVPGGWRFKGGVRYGTAAVNGLILRRLLHTYETPKGHRCAILTPDGEDFARGLNKRQAA